MILSVIQMKQTSKRIGHSLTSAGFNHRTLGWTAISLSIILLGTGMIRGTDSNKKTVQLITIGFHFVGGVVVYLCCGN